MKKLLLVVLVSISFMSSAKDMILLKNGEKIWVTITDLKQNIIFYKETRKGDIQTLTSEEVELIHLDKKNTFIQDMVASELQQQNLLDDTKCLEGKLDASNYHGRAFGNFCLGFLFGPFGVVGTALGKPKSPDYAVIPNKENLSNPEYLACYKKKAKGKNVGYAALGWLTLILLVAASN